MKQSHFLETVVGILLLIAGIDLGLMGLFGFDLIAAIFGMMSALTRILYIAMGLAAVYKIVYLCKSRSQKS